MPDGFGGFDWDEGNRGKCAGHGVSMADIEGLFLGPVVILPDHAHSHAERRFRAIGRTRLGRAIFVVFTMRDRDGMTSIRPISARYMHAAEIEAYEKDNPQLRDR